MNEAQKQRYNFLIRQIDMSNDFIKSRQSYCFNAATLAFAFQGVLVPLLSSTLELDCTKSSIAGWNLGITTGLILLFVKFNWDIWLEQDKMKYYSDEVEKLFVVGVKHEAKDVEYWMKRAFSYLSSKSRFRFGEETQKTVASWVVSIGTTMGYLLTFVLIVVFLVQSDRGNMSLFKANCHNDTRH